MTKDLRCGKETKRTKAMRVVTQFLQQPAATDEVAPADPDEDSASRFRTTGAGDSVGTSSAEHRSVVPWKKIAGRAKTGKLWRENPP